MFLLTILRVDAPLKKATPGCVVTMATSLSHRVTQHSARAVDRETSWNTGSVVKVIGSRTEGDVRRDPGADPARDTWGSRKDSERVQRLTWASD